jgi:Holliday junction resolvase RusA-like endonuclease
MFVTEEDLKLNPKLGKLVQNALAKEEKNKWKVAEKFIVDQGNANMVDLITKPNARILYKGNIKSAVVQLEPAIYIFNITPIGKPRMTRRDKWAKTRTVAASKYMVWRNQLELLVDEQKFTIGDGVQVIFLLPFKKNWSKEKCEEMRGMPHQEKPDTDNMLKGFIDVLAKSDQRIYDKHPLKFWWDTGKIVVVRNVPLYQNLMQIDTVYNALQGTKHNLDE